MVDVIRHWLQLPAVPPRRVRTCSSGRTNGENLPGDPRVPAEDPSDGDEEFRGGCSWPKPTVGPRTSSTTRPLTGMSATLASIPA